MSKAPLSQLVPFTCFDCRSTYKRPFEKEIMYRKCPTCGCLALCMDTRFRPPKKSDDKQWKKVKYLVEHGFIFQKIYRKDGPVWHRERYPRTYEQAKEFVIKHKDQAFEVSI